jgi:hypothetical protein
VAEVFAWAFRVDYCLLLHDTVTREQLPGGVDLRKFASMTYTRVQSVMLTGGHGTKLTALTLVQGLLGSSGGWPLTIAS